MIIKARLLPYHKTLRKLLSLPNMWTAKQSSF